MTEAAHALARHLMDDFALRTGLVGDRPPRRYLWTDAFAVCTFFALDDLGLEPGDGVRDDGGGGTSYRDLALRLVEQVHHVLGRHRPDDVREGWISGLPEAEGEEHPTAGGLRIGKELPEREEDEPLDPRREWDRDGQYLHYLTKWMHALQVVSRETGEGRYYRQAVELAEVAHAAFTVREAPGKPPERMAWKMSIGLDRPLVPSSGHHDPLDVLLTCLELATAAGGDGGGAEEGYPVLEDEIREAAALCRGARWATEDPLGIGGLLTDVARLGWMTLHRGVRRRYLVDQLLEDASVSLEVFHRGSPLDLPATHRLAFRELGLSIGLRGVEATAPQIAGEKTEALVEGLGRDAAGALAALLRYRPLADHVEGFWSSDRARRSPTWQDHEDINAVMLATSLAPGGYLRW